MFINKCWIFTIHSDMHNVNFTQAYNFLLLLWYDSITTTKNHSIWRISEWRGISGYLLFPRFSLCVGEIEIEDLSFDRQTDSAMATSDSNPATPHPSFVVTFVYFRCVFSSSFITHNNIFDFFGFRNICCSIDQIMGFSISCSTAECYRSHIMFARRSLSIQEEWVSVVGNVSKT